MGSIRLFFVILSLVSLLFPACFPDKTAVLVDDPSKISKLNITHPTKIFLQDGSQVLLPEGFQVRNEQLIGNGIKHKFNSYSAMKRNHQVPLDSISAMTYYELESSGASSFASFLLVIYGVTFFPVSLYCIACPKCCFGSCPTVYTGDSLNAELFSYNISRFFQETDIDKINFDRDSRDELTIRVANEALETHYINQLEMIQLNHPIGTNAYPDEQGDIAVTENEYPPGMAVNSEGNDIRSDILDRDNVSYRSDSLFASRLKQKKLTDWIELEFDSQDVDKNLYLVLRLRNTLLTTVLFYDLVLESQGVLAVDWTAKMQNDFLYAKFFNDVYQKFAGIRFYVYEDGEWIYKAKLGDVGPIAWKDMAVEISPSLRPLQEKIKIRLEFFPDNFVIDYLACTNIIADDTALNKHILEPQIKTGNVSNIPDEIFHAIQKSDEKYLETNPGQIFSISYKPETSINQTSTFFLKSTGYYIEWLRGNWISTKTKSYKFNLINTDATISYLYEIWQRDRPLLEQEFFKNRIPVKEVL